MATSFSRYDYHQANPYKTYKGWLHEVLQATSLLHGYM